ncbi:2'-5' RNA ligase family protein [Pseudalkalibacillus berkeleyi]|uniref:2'-5' RNA ligase family protein n=1 Tax=Pseudalkalibacillus berkeleyi TaxID=1069813 RepID=A0ABS9GUZ3_9BACL|nr:2'-5' RNA ligase family protein [Pseudalkalibacillus berkeleyi]MCF6136647.1 2'-5' RNA ligase family protein [Pseudalkalibacillus berkeleyi]
MLILKEGSLSLEANSMYAVELFFDDQIDQFVRGIWEGLKQKNITSSLADMEDLVPHITLGVYDTDLPVDQLIERLEQIPFNSFDIHYDALATFPSTGTLFLAPTMSTNLYKAHEEFHKEFNEFRHLSNEYYLPNKWYPHTTLAINLDSKMMLEAYNYCLHNFTPLKGKITEIAVDKINTSEQEWNSKTIYSKKLI